MPQHVATQLVECIESRDRLRAVDEEKVRQIAESIKAIGLLNPICVRYVDESAKCLLVAGAHRLAAAKLLGWESIAVVEFEGDELTAELVEIDENLQRAELTPAQRAAAIHRRKEIWEVLHPEIQVGQLVPPEIGYKMPPPQSVAFAADTAKASGESKRDINRAVARAEALGPDIHEVVGTSLDKGVELDALKALPAEERRELIDRAKAGEKVTARPTKTEPQQVAKVPVIAQQGAALDQGEVEALKAEVAALREELAVKQAMLDSYDTVLEPDQQVAAKELAKLKGQLRTISATRDQWMTTAREAQADVKRLRRKLDRLEAAS